MAGLTPLPSSFPSTTNQSSPKKVALGQMLFFDRRLSVNATIACASCHDLNRYGVDGRPTSIGFDGRAGRRNAPSVYNAAAHVAQFWDGRAPDVEAQALGPIFNPIEMGMKNQRALEQRLAAIPGYVDAFRAAFPDESRPLRAENIARAIAAFERQLTTPSRFDRFLMGEQTALSEDERCGLTNFVSFGCTTCHSGVGIGGASFQKLGLVEEWPNQRDLGRFDVTHDDSDRMRFRVSSLRNIAQTAPYFHDGSVADLARAVRLMARHQLGRELTEEQTRTIVAFLRSLTGSLPAGLALAPQLPSRASAF
jgi:cytochrome c peroxidase